MKKLLTKTLFISLMSLAVIPSGVQADAFTAGSTKFAKTALGVTVGAGVGMKLATKIINQFGLKVRADIMIEFAGAGVGAAVVKAAEGAGVEEIIGAGVGALGGAAAGGMAAGEAVSRLGVRGGREILAAGVIAGGTIGAEAVAAIIRKIREKYFNRRTYTGEIIGRASRTEIS